MYKFNLCYTLYLSTVHVVSSHCGGRRNSLGQFPKLRGGCDDEKYLEKSNQNLNQISVVIVVLYLF